MVVTADPGQHGPAALGRADERLGERWAEPFTASWPCLLRRSDRWSADHRSSVTTRSTVVPCRLKNPRARPRKPVALSLRSSGRISVQASREASSLATCRWSQPRPRFFVMPLQWPVMRRRRRLPACPSENGRASADARWPIPSMRPSFLVSRWISSPGCSRSRRMTGGFGSSAASRPGPSRRSTAPAVETGRRTCRRWRVRTGALAAAERSGPRRRHPGAPASAAGGTSGHATRPRPRRRTGPATCARSSDQCASRPTSPTLRPSLSRPTVSTRRCGVVHAFRWASIRGSRSGVAGFTTTASLPSLGRTTSTTRTGLA